VSSGIVLGVVIGAVHRRFRPAALGERDDGRISLPASRIDGANGDDQRVAQRAHRNHDWVLGFALALLAVSSSGSAGALRCGAASSCDALRQME